MATLQKIRTRAGLLIAIVIGISLAAFILGDLLQSGSSILQRSQLEVGEINGESIQYQQFQKQVEELGEIYKQNLQQSQLDENNWAQVREQTWQTMVQEIVMGDVYDDLGIDVSSDELFDMLQGANLHPIVQQIFRNPNTGQVDRGAVVNFLKNLDTNVAPEQRAYWLYLEKQIVNERKQAKYSGMVGKGLYVTSSEVQNSVNEKSKAVNFEYVSLNYNTVSDSSISVSESDLKSYYEDNKSNFKQEKSRQIEYVEFPVKPSAADYKDAEDWINGIKADFANATDNVQFVNSNSDVSFNSVWYKKESLPAAVGSWIFDEGAKENDVYGPYFENEAYTLAKVDTLAMLPDSVKARHILIRVNTQEELAAAQKLADSLKTVIEKGGDFAALALQYSTDQGSAVKGGDLGWFGRGMMVKPFEDAAFNNDKNEVSIAMSQFGIHVIQTTDKGKPTLQAQVAFLVRNVTSSTRTEQDIYAQASKFAIDNDSKEKFNKAVVEQKLNKKVATVRETDLNIVGLQNARVLVRSAYEGEVGNILKTSQESPIFELGNNFVIAVLTKATEEGEATFEDARTQVELAVRKQKKVELLSKKASDAAQGKSDMYAIASALNTNVGTADNVDFNTFSVPGLGLEPALVGTVTAMGTGKISKPVEGNNGVYLAKIVTETPVPGVDAKMEQTRLSQNVFYKASSQAFESQRKKAEITDKRAKFY